MNRPVAWISDPVCVIADHAERTVEPANHLTYRRVYEAHGREWTSAATAGPVPDAWPLSAEELARDALVPLLDGHRLDRIDAFVDCRSGAMVAGPAPTYRLAISVGMTTAAPVCLWGQDGPELVFGISVVARRLLADGTAVVSVGQRIVSPDTRAPAWTSLTLGDAAAAVRLSRRPFPGGRPILAVHLERTRPAGTDPLERALHKARLAREQCTWTVVSGPSVTPVAGDTRWPATYFGVADVFVRLAERPADRDRDGIGALLSYGRAGTSAAMILGAEERNVD